MACEVCEHCNSPVKAGEGVIQNGFSYHKKCKKCYVCSETNLENAEIFKGVIFCSGCSKRIFQGCVSARKVKAKSRKKHKKAHREDNNRVIELARVHSAINSDSSKSKVSDPLSTDSTVVSNKTYKTKTEMKKDSIDMATTTDVTQELLMHFFSTHNTNEKFAPIAKPRKQRKSHKEKDNKNGCSDLRMAELGTSTEIAHMALRRRSEVPVIIKSESRLRKMKSNSLSFITQESDSSGDYNEDSIYYSEDSLRKHWMDRPIRSIIKLPCKSFKRNILERSSMISAIVNSEESTDFSVGKSGRIAWCILRRFKKIFREEITEHQRRGLRKLFSTINHKKIPYKLGWLEVMTKIPEDTRLSDSSQGHEEKRCRHFRTSHSYRCMRKQVMRLAGPTRSELTVLRSRLKDLVFFQFLRGIFNFNKQFVQMLTSQACT